MNFVLFTVPCPDSRSETLRLEADLEAGAEDEALPFLSVACNFFQLLERLAVSIPRVPILSTLLHCDEKSWSRFGGDELPFTFSADKKVAR